MVATKGGIGNTGLKNFIFMCTDFCARKIVLHAKLHVYKTVTVWANLHCLIYNVLIDIILPVCFDTKKTV